MNKKWYLFLVIIMVGAMVLTACGGNNDNNTVEPGNSNDSNNVVDEPVVEPTDEPVEEPTDEPVEEPTDEPMDEPTDEPAVPENALIIWADDTRTPILQALADDFEAEYGVALVVEQVADIREQFGIAAPAGEGPDILVGAHDWIGELIESGLLAEMDLGDKRDQFLDSALQGFTYNGTLYGMPYAIENMAFFYNTDLMDAPPETWEEVTEVSRELVANGDVQYGIVAPNNSTYDAFPLYTAFGGYIFGQDDTGQYIPTDVGLDSEGFIAAGDWLQAMIDEGLMASDTDWDTAHALFETGEAAMIMAGPWALDRFRGAGVPYAAAPFPAAEQAGQPFLGVQGFMVNAQSEQILLAQAFLTEFVATDETMQALQDAGNRPSAFIPVFENIDDEDLVTFGEIGRDASLMPAIPEMASVWSSWGDAITLIFQGEQSAEDALQNAADQIRTAIDEGG